MSFSAYAVAVGGVGASVRHAPVEVTDARNELGPHHQPTGPALLPHTVCAPNYNDLMADVTQILSAIEAGDPKAAAQLLPLVYDELRKLAAARMAEERADHTLQPTALVHEAYLRLVGGDPGRQWNGRGHFFAAAAEAMRRILINRAREGGRLKRGGSYRRVELDGMADPFAATPDDLLDLDDALEKLAASYPQAAELVKLRFFAGLSIPEAAASIGVPPRSADRLWAFARAWLIESLVGG